jgi:uncharacterized protein involved in exopolysaccharide biosynthesis
MAKKKKRAAKKKTAKRSAKKTTSKKKPAVKKPKAKKAPASVDTILKQFAKDRSTKESQLEALRKKQREVQEKVSKLREEAAKLSEKASQTEADLKDLDSQRDQEVTELLSNLGVNFNRRPGGLDSVQDSKPPGNVSVSPGASGPSFADRRN